MARMKLYSSTSKNSSSKTIREEYKTISGPKVDYSKYFMQAPKAPEYYKPNVKSEADMSKIAKDRVNGVFDSYIKNSQLERDFNIESIRQAMEGLNPIYQERMGMLLDSYGEKERDILNTALSRGMGRSSYVEDSKSENSAKLAKGLSSLDLEKRQTEKQLTRDIEKENLKYNQAKNKYGAQKDMEVKSLIYEMQKERDKALFDAQKYNDSLYQNYAKLVQQQQKHNLDVQKYIDSLNTKKVTVTTTNTTSNSSTYKVDNSLDRDRVMKLWNSMGTEDKVKYVTKNKSILERHAPDLLVDFTTEATLEYMKKSFNMIGPIFGLKI